MPSSDNPVGIFDSGIGGLTVLSAVRRRLPQEPIIYLGDTARVPYGTKSAETIVTYARRNIAFLKGERVKGVVIACNTASALALESIKDELDLPVIGVVEPGVEAAVEATRTERVGVIGTEATIASGAYAERIQTLNSWIKVTSKACPLFVPLVEEGWTDGEIPLKVARHYLEDMVRAEIDTLILGCTHYPVLKKVIQEVVGPNVQLIDSAETVATSLARLLDEMQLLATGSRSGGVRYFVTDSAEGFAAVARRLIPDPIDDITRVDF